MARNHTKHTFYLYQGETQVTILQSQFLASALAVKRIYGWPK